MSETWVKAEYAAALDIASGALDWLVYKGLVRTSVTWPSPRVRVVRFCKEDIDSEAVRLKAPPVGWELEDAVLARLNARQNAELLIGISDRYLHTNANGAWVLVTFVDAAALELRLAASAVPHSVTARQLRLALVQSGMDLSAITTALGLLPEPTRTAVLITWEYANEFDRTSPLIAGVAPLLSLTSEQVDDLFVLAGSL